MSPRRGAILPAALARYCESNKVNFLLGLDTRERLSSFIPNVRLHSAFYIWNFSETVWDGLLKWTGNVLQHA